MSLNGSSRWNSNGTPAVTMQPRIYRAPLVFTPIPTQTTTPKPSWFVGGRTKTIPFPTETNDTATFSDDDEQILRDLIAPRVARSPLAPITTESNLVSILARRVIQVNARTIEERTKSSMQTRNERERERERDHLHHRDSQRHRHRDERRSSREETENRTPRDHTSQRQSSHPPSSRSHQEKSSSHSKHTDPPSSPGHAKRRSSIDRHEEDSHTHKSKRTSPHSHRSRPHTPPVSSLTQDEVDQKTNDRSSYFFPNPAQPVQTHSTLPPPPIEPHHTDGTSSPPIISPPAAAAPLFPEPPSNRFPFSASFIPPPSIASGPNSLSARAAHELRILETLQDSRASLAALAHQHSLNLVQAQTEKLAAEIAAKERQRVAEEQAQAQARAEFIARTHHIDAAREQEKLAAKAEAERLRDALHQAQLQSQYQSSLLAQELEREKARSQQQERDAKHQLELERLKRELLLQNDAASTQKIREAQEKVAAQVQERQKQHDKALDLALKQVHHQAVQFDQLKELTHGLQEVTKQQVSVLQQVVQEEKSKDAQARTREQEVLEHMGRLQRDTVAAIVAATERQQPPAPVPAPAPAPVHPLDVLANRPIQVQLLGLPTMLSLQSQQQPQSIPLPLPQTSPIGSGRRRGEATTGVPAGHRSRSASISQSAAYSDDFDMGGTTDQSQLSGRRMNGAQQHQQPQQLGIDEEDYEEDFSAPSVAPTPRASTKTLQQRTTAAKPSPHLQARRSFGEEVSIEFEEGVEEPAAAQFFHLQASPIPVRGAATRIAAGEEEIELEIEEDAGAPHVGEIETEPEVEHSNTSDVYVSEEKIEIEEEPAARSQSRVTPRKPVDQSIEYADDFLAASPAASGSFSGASARKAAQSIEEESMTAGASRLHASVPEEEDIHVSEAYHEDSFAASGTSVGSKHAPRGHPGVATPLDQSIGEEKHLGASDQYEESFGGASVKSEVEEEPILHSSTGHISSAPEEIETEPEVEHSASSQSYVSEEKIEIEEDDHTPVRSPSRAGSRRQVDQSMEYDDDFLAASPTASGSFSGSAAKKIAQSIEEESIATAGSRLHASVPEEEDIHAESAGGSEAYQEDTFEASATSVGSKHAPRGQPVGVATPLDQSIAEEKHGASEQYDESFGAGSAVSIKSSRSARGSAGQVAAAAAGASSDAIGDGTHYSDSFVEPASPASAEAATTKPPAVAPTSPKDEYADSFIAGEEDPAAGSMNESVAEELSQPPSANHSMSHEQLEASQTGAGALDEHQLEPTSTLAPPKSPGPFVVAAPLSPVHGTSEVEEDASVVTGEDLTLDRSPSIPDAISPAASLTRTAGRPARMRLAELEAQAREKQDETKTEEVQSPKEPSEETKQQNKEELANAITLRLLQDLTQELKAEQAAMPKVRKRRAPPVSSIGATPMESAVINQLQEELLNDSLGEVDRIAAVKKARAAGASGISTGILSPSNLSPASTSSSTISSPPTSTSLSPLPAHAHSTLLDSPLGLNPASSQQAPGYNKIPSLVDDDWLLDNAATTSPPQSHATIAAGAIQTSQQLDQEVLAQIAAEPVKPPQPHLQQSREYVSALLHQVFQHSEPASPKSTDPPQEIKAKLLPLLTGAALAHATEALRETYPNDGVASPEAVEAQAAFNRLLLATANQYIQSYNASVVSRDMSGLPWMSAEDHAELALASDADQEDLLASTLPLSQQRVRRAPGGLILSLKPHTSVSSLSQWENIIVRKVTKKVVQMGHTTKALAASVAEAALHTKLPGPGAQPEEVAEGGGTPKLYMGVVLDLEVSLVNNILAKQMQSVEPGPAGATLRDWKQHRGVPPVDVSMSPDDSLSSADSSHSSILYSGSECEWEGGYEAIESTHVVAEIADNLLTQLLAELVQNATAIEDRKYTRKLVTRARARDKMKSHQISTSGGSSTLGVPGLDSPEISSATSPLTPQETAERKKARRQAIKL